MKSFIDRLLRNPVTFELICIFSYTFYCLIFAIGATPSIFFIHQGYQLLDNSLITAFAFTIICFLSFYFFLILESIVIGLVERVMTLGLKPGSYPTGSFTFLRWLVYSGLHLWFVNLILPFLHGNNWIKLYLRIAGAKIGKETFINTKQIFDPYLLEIGSNVVIGGHCFLNCHMFEHGYLCIDKIVIRDGATIGARAYITPGTYVGKKSAVGMNTHLRRNTVIEDGRTIMTPPGMGIRQIVKLIRDKEKQSVNELQTTSNEEEDNIE